MNSLSVANWDLRAILELLRTSSETDSMQLLQLIRTANSLEESLDNICGALVLSSAMGISRQSDNFSASSCNIAERGTRNEPTSNGRYRGPFWSTKNSTPIEHVPVHFFN